MLESENAVKSLFKKENIISLKFIKNLKENLLTMRTNAHII